MARGRRLSWLTALVLVTGSPLADAQDIEWGIEGGLDVSSVGSTEQDYFRALDFQSVLENQALDEPSVKGGTLGAFVRFPVTDRLGVQPEVLFARKGHRFHLPQDQVDGSLDLDVLDIGVLGRVRVAGGEASSVYVLGGPVIGIRMNEKSDIVVEGMSFLDDSFFPDDPQLADAFRRLSLLSLYPVASPDLLRRSTVALSIGAGVRVGRFFGEVRVKQAITSLIGDSGDLTAAYRDLEALVDAPPGALEPPAEILNLLDPVFSDAKMREFLVLGGVTF